VNTKRRTRAFWRKVVGEVERGGTVASTARVHGVKPNALAWWRWTLRREAVSPPKSARLLPVVSSPGFAATPETFAHRAIAIELREGVTVRVPVGSDVGYVAALVAAVRHAC
jgi:transposase-like protein